MHIRCYVSYVSGVTYYVKLLRNVREWMNILPYVRSCVKKYVHVNVALLFVLIQQITVTFFSYSIRNYNALTSEIQTKDNLGRNFLGEILKGFFVTVEI